MTRLPKKPTLKKSQKERDAAIDAALENLECGNVPRCGHKANLALVEPCLTESGENLFMCHFPNGTTCNSCGAEKPGGEGCFSVSVNAGRQLGPCTTCEKIAPLFLLSGIAYCLECFKAEIAIAAAKKAGFESVDAYREAWRKWLPGQAVPMPKGDWE
jgi:hypothetical protein